VPDFHQTGSRAIAAPTGRDNAPFIRSIRTLRIRQFNGLKFSTAKSISPLPTILDYGINSEIFS